MVIVIFMYNVTKLHFIFPEYLSSHIVDSRIISLQPRGLINRSNYCYINSILQAMLACPPVYNLLNGLAHETPNEKEQLPIISGM